MYCRLLSSCYLVWRDQLIRNVLVWSRSSWLLASVVTLFIRSWVATFLHVKQLVSLGVFDTTKNASYGTRIWYFPMRSMGVPTSFSTPVLFLGTDLVLQHHMPIVTGWGVSVLPNLAWHVWPTSTYPARFQFLIDVKTEIWTNNLLDTLIASQSVASCILMLISFSPGFGMYTGQCDNEILPTSFSGSSWLPCFANKTTFFAHIVIRLGCTLCTTKGWGDASL